MVIKTIGTGSSGNCYVLETSNKNIILDCGLPFEQIKHSELFPKFKDISFVFISHCHHDHNKSLKDFKKSGCEIVSYENLEKKVQQRNIDNFTITTFPIEHNVNNWGIVIRDNNEGTKLCYVTDFTHMPKVENIDHYIYEINYIEAEIDAKVDAGGYGKFKHNGFVHHNSLENAIRYFESLETKPTTINICHISKDNGSWRKIKKQLKQHFENITINLLEPNKIITLKEKTNGKRQ